MMLRIIPLKIIPKDGAKVTNGNIRGYFKFAANSILVPIRTKLLRMLLTPEHFQSIPP